MYQATLPLPLRILNLAGKSLRLFGIRGASLNPERLIKRARQSTNLSDFGPEDFRIGLNILCKALETEAELTAFGRLLAQTEILLTLENRLKLIHAFKVNRELSGAPVKRPLFILGLPQSGTALLHQLMAQDPDNRVPMTWETKYPFPPPRTETYLSDPRINKVAKELKHVDRLMPEFKRIYPLAADQPQECVAFTAMNFMSMGFCVSYRVPSYQRWLQHEAEFRGAYNLHYQFLQFLQWRHKGERWVLSSPGHLWSLDTLISRYPDAMIVQAHRDPVKVMCSLSSLTYTLRSINTDNANMHDIAADQSALIESGLNRNTALRKSGKLPGTQLFDFNYEELMADPIALVKRVYRYFNLPLSNEAESNMRRYLQENPEDKYGKHRYHFMTTGLRLDEERRRYRDYQEYFAIATEKV